jgi:hypothetical protein
MGWYVPAPHFKHTLLFINEPGAQAAVHVVAEPSLKRPAPHGWQAVDMPSMKYWLVPQHTFELVPVHRLVPEEQDPPQSVHDAAPMPLYFPGGQRIHVVPSTAPW